MSARPQECNVWGNLLKDTVLTAYIISPSLPREKERGRVEELHTPLSHSQRENGRERVEELHPPLSHSQRDKERGRVEELHTPLSHSQREKERGRVEELHTPFRGLIYS